MELVKVALDAMGGDNAPGAIVQGAIEAVKAREELFVYLVGQTEAIKAELNKYSGYDEKRVEIVEAPDIITNDEAPVDAIRHKDNSSVVKALYLVKNGQADAIVSAGSTGALLVGGQLIIGRIKGVRRSPLAPLIPTLDGVSLLLDCGANVDAKAVDLVQFAKMGSIYMENIMGVKNPKIGLVNIGVEEEKGNALVKETYPMLKNSNDINFIGSVESREIPYGAADVIVTEAFVGNVIIKLYEGVAGALLKRVKEGFKSTPVSMMGAALAKPALKKTLKGFSIKEYGGAPMLGLKALVVKSHGNSDYVEIKNSLIQCIDFKKQRINEKIEENISANSEVSK
ncbi:MAG TPA: phosphate acyltransferase PlsX [Lachnospiraceae bacterium]|jgi:glycerol-3-phosphate acyltransferase PlsX|nr:phosphate acyltransferase PlsX [Lachnospiraceae bacterium]HBR05256.1 phosphate acyltransferase PlsX [Lachnospiraceae bacterium]HBZ90224.1 phosphate acyltransferase PlsX [Lachnospiraceae bacterium]